MLDNTKYGVIFRPQWIVYNFYHMLFLDIGKK